MSRLPLSGQLFSGAKRCVPVRPPPRSAALLRHAIDIQREALTRQKLLLLEEGHCLRGHALDVCGTGDMRVREQFEASSLHTLVQLVAAGIGVTLASTLRTLTVHASAIR